MSFVWKFKETLIAGVSKVGYQKICEVIKQNESEVGNRMIASKLLSFLTSATYFKPDTFESLQYLDLHNLHLHDCFNNLIFVIIISFQHSKNTILQRQTPFLLQNTNLVHKLEGARTCVHLTRGNEPVNSASMCTSFISVWFYRHGENNHNSDDITLGPVWTCIFIWHAQLFPDTSKNVLSAFLF